MKGKHSIFLLLILVALMSCNDPKPVTEILYRAEALMNEYPDSAWTLLNTISPDEMGQNRNRALYALLYTQAQDKTYRDETNDSLISVAVDYFRDTDDVRHKFLSYYYKGRVYFNGKDYLNATTCYMEAEQLASEIGDDYLVGLLYAELGRIYRLYYDYPKSLEAYQKAADCYEQGGKIRHRNYMWYNLSSIYRNINEYNTSERLLKMALETAKLDNDSSLVELCLGDLVMLCVEQNRMLEAKEFDHRLQLLVDEDDVSASYWGVLVKICTSNRNFSLAKQWLEKGWERAETCSDSINLYLASSDMLYALGHERIAYQELMKGVALQNQETYQALQQPVLTAQRDYLSESLEFESYKLRMKKLLNLVSTLFFLLLLGVSVYVFVRVFKKQKKESQQVISDLEDEKNKLEEEKGKIALALQQLDEDKRKADRTIAMLREEINKEKEENDTEISALLEKLEQERTVSHQMLQTLNDVMAQKEESRNKMEILIQRLEDDGKSHKEAVDCLRAELETLQNKNQKITSQIADLLKNHLEKMAEVILLREEQSLSEEKRVKRVNDGISLLKKDYFAGKGEFRKVEALVNLYFDDVMVHFREEVELPKESDYRRVCYMFAGLSGQVIGQIMNESKDVVYQRRKRLLQKIASLSCPHKEMFIMLFCK